MLIYKITQMHKERRHVKWAMMRSKLCSIEQQISTNTQTPHQKLQMMHEAVIV
jgi:hypothetical protein